MQRRTTTNDCVVIYTRHIHSLSVRKLKPQASLSYEAFFCTRNKWCQWVVRVMIILLSRLGEIEDGKLCWIIFQRNDTIESFSFFSLFPKRRSRAEIYCSMVGQFFFINNFRVHFCVSFSWAFNFCFVCYLLSPGIFDVVVGRFFFSSVSFAFGERWRERIMAAVSVSAACDLGQTIDTKENNDLWYSVQLRSSHFPTNTRRDANARAQLLFLLCSKVWNDKRS